MPQLSIDAICMNTEPVPDWLIPDTLYRGSQILIAAMEGVGKSAFCYTLSNALATGSEFIGRVGPCRVLYFDEENARGELAAYVRWSWRGLGSPSLDLLRANLRIESLTLGVSLDWSMTMRTLAAEFKPDLIIVDTANPACHIRNENDNGEASAASHEIRLAQAVAGPGCCAIVLKHLRLNSELGRLDVRGAKAWKGAVDAIWFHLARPGRRRPDGWRNTYIRPEKYRAYGLRDVLSITPRVEPQSLFALEIRRDKSDGLEP